jgi:hypothetical protein
MNKVNQSFKLLIISVYLTIILFFLGNKISEYMFSLGEILLFLSNILFFFIPILLINYIYYVKKNCPEKLITILIIISIIVFSFIFGKLF